VEYTRLVGAGLATEADRTRVMGIIETRTDVRAPSNRAPGKCSWHPARDGQDLNCPTKGCTHFRKRVQAQLLKILKEPVVVTRTASGRSLLPRPLVLTVTLQQQLPGGILATLTTPRVRSIDDHAYDTD
jgi:hypothetical protein